METNVKCVVPKKVNGIAVKQNWSIMLEINDDDVKTKDRKLVDRSYLKLFEAIVTHSGSLLSKAGVRTSITIDEGKACYVITGDGRYLYKGTHLLTLVLGILCDGIYSTFTCNKDGFRYTVNHVFPEQLTTLVETTSNIELSVSVNYTDTEEFTKFIIKDYDNPEIVSEYMIYHKKLTS